MGIFNRRPTYEPLDDTFLTESIAEDRIDRENGVIRGVMVLGKESLNGRRYSDRAVQDACRLYEGVEVNVNHVDRKDLHAERGMSDGWGVLKSCRIGTRGVSADLHYLKEHPATNVLLERVARGFPIGLSHHARGKVSIGKGRPIVESIQRVRSVDVVRQPATNHNLFESEETMRTTTLRQLIESTGYKYTRALLEMLPDEVDPTAPVEVPAEEGEAAAGDGAQAVVETLAGEAAKIIADPEIDSAATLAKVKSIIKTVETVKSDLGPDSPAPETEPEGDGEEKPADDEEKKLTESIQRAVKAVVKPLQESVKSLQFTQRTHELLEEHGVQFGNLRADMRADLAKQTTEKGVRELLESWPPAFRGQRLHIAPLDTDKPTKHVPLKRMARR